MGGARFYWPELNRFIQQDPIGDGVNWYAYVGNNPVVWVDPEGLASFPCNWYWKTVGGWGEWVDKMLLAGATAGFGETAGLHDAGQASRWEVATAGGKWGGMVALTAFTATEAPGVRLALRPKYLGVQARVYGRFWGFADVGHAAHHSFPFLGPRPHAQIGAFLFGKTRMVRIPYPW